MSLWSEIKEDLFGPSRESLAETRRAIRSLLELRQLRKDEACVDRLGSRGYLNYQEGAELYRQMLARVRKLEPRVQE